MEGAAASAGTQAETSLSHARKWLKSATPTLRRCPPGASRTATEGVADFRRFGARDRGASP
eukprot:3624091-Alexandrium_andersonii.AAC.1